MGRLVVVTGTGTEIGKTHVACALVRAWRDRAVVAGIKPIESGVLAAEGCDGHDLRKASSFHVKHLPAPYLFPDPVSPHLAARRMGVHVELSVVQRYVDHYLKSCDAVVLELAGGLFSPISDSLRNSDLIAGLKPDVVLLVAPDQLGVLHDVHAAVLSARTVGLRIDGIVLSEPDAPDASTGTNEPELTPGVPVLAIFPRTPRAEPTSQAAHELLEEIEPRNGE